MTDLLTILQGNCLKRLRELPDDRFQMCVTSPPYWNLRDYGTAEWEGGDAECTHEIRRAAGKRQSKAYHHGKSAKADRINRKQCRCGALRRDEQIGLEDTPAEYAASIVEVFQEVRRVLKPDGCCYINIGDSYNGAGQSGGTNPEMRGTLSYRGAPGGSTVVRSLKPKDMIGMPWMIAFALRDDGWYLRSEIIWYKPNPMPESIEDRPTKAHEQIFLLSKSERYFWDKAAVKEKTTGNAHPRGDGINPKSMKAPEGWDMSIGEGRHGNVHRGGRGKIPGRNSRMNVTRDGSCPPQPRQNESFSAAVTGLVDTRNQRTIWQVEESEWEQFQRWKAMKAGERTDVWEIPTFPFPDAHFATYPPDLIKPCILAGSRMGDEVLDPFAGSGTTGAVAIELGRRATLIELNGKYIPMIRARCNVTPGFL